MLGLVHEAIARAHFFVATGQLDPTRRDDEIRIIRHAYEQASELGNPNLLGAGAMALGRALCTVDLDAAQPYLEQAAAVTAPLGLALLSGQCSCALAELHTRANRPTDALVVLGAALRLHLSAGDIADVIIDLSSCVAPLRQVGQSALADAVADAIGRTGPERGSTPRRISVITSTVLAHIELIAPPDGS
ncbi:MAG: hypothetical protein QM733_09450 [Ilumatobacteraceae bacterium]